MKFKVGDSVCWQSQAGGSTAIKFGFVVEVVPQRKLPEQRPRGSTVVPRGRESYVIRTSRILRGGSMKHETKMTWRQESRLYWPYASQLCEWHIPAHDVTNMVEAKAVINNLAAELDLLRKELRESKVAP